MSVVGASLDFLRLDFWAANSNISVKSFYPKLLENIGIIIASDISDFISKFNLLTV